MNGRRMLKFKAHKHIHVIHAPFTSAAVTAEGLPKGESQFNGVNILCKEGPLKDVAAVTLNSNTNAYTYASLLRTCTNIKSLNQVHARILVTGHHQNACLVAKLVSVYTMCGALESARLVFDRVCKPNVFLWNAIIEGYARVGLCEQTLQLYHQMQQAGMEPNKFTFPFVLKACARISALQEGKEVHHQIVRSGFESDVFVRTALIDMYAKCRRIEVARQLFDKMCQRDLVSWNAMIAGYAQSKHSSEALGLFHQMQLAGVTSNIITILSRLPACLHLQQGKWIHGYIIRTGFESDVSVVNALVTMYARCRSVEVARQLFDKMAGKDMISWNTMICP